jgi:hypothetical protein
MSAKVPLVFSRLPLDSPVKPARMHLLRLLNGSSPTTGSISYRFAVSPTNQLNRNGLLLVPGVLPIPQCQRLIELLGPVTGAGRRGLLELPEIARVSGSTLLLALVAPHLGQSPRAVRAIYFDKTADSNWGVAFHQDLTIAVAKRIDVPGFGPWSIKNAVPHVQPPVALLDRMLTVRLHLDDCDETNGALRVLPGTHSSGRLATHQIETLRQKFPETICSASAGDALLMRPLLLHASGKSFGSGHRRVLHLEYASGELPGGLAWHE